MTDKTFITASEMAEMLGVSVSRAYRICRKLNEELTAKGYLVVAGRVPTKYFEKIWFTGE